jgi:hypothetical protein
MPKPQSTLIAVSFLIRLHLARHLGGQTAIRPWMMAADYPMKNAIRSGSFLIFLK